MSNKKKITAKHTGVKSAKSATKQQTGFSKVLATCKTTLTSKVFWKRLGVGLLAVLVFTTVLNYSVALWYQHTQRNKPFSLGVTFVSGYASSFGLSPHETYSAILDDLEVRQLRLVSYWDVIEPTEGVYDFSDLDWQFAQAEAVGAKISLAVGLRQPRWPECHAPSWVDIAKPRAEWQPQLETFMTKVVERYKNSPSLESYQLENEYYNTMFGECHDANRTRLAEEKALVKQLDPTHPVIISRSNNTPTLMLRDPVTDLNAFTLYRKVYDKTITKRYFTYPMPPWHYGAIAGWQKILGGQDSIIHELQAEPWPPEGQGGITGISLEEQNKTLDADRLRAHVKFAEDTGMRHIDLWGAEYWYYRKVKLHEPSVWDAARDIFHNQN